MDPVSQAALGAVVAQSVGHRRLGLKVAIIGAAAGAMPDADVLFSITGDFVDQLVTHRGITHSLFFAPIVGPLLGWLVWKAEAREDPGFRRRNCWMLATTLAILSHPLLDLLTPYGTQLLQPFSNARFAINAMPIIDPVYTLMLLAGLYIAFRSARTLRRTPEQDSQLPDSAGISFHAGRIAGVTLLLSCAYLGWGWWLNEQTEVEANRQLAQSGIHNAQVAAFPTVLQIHYRRVVARLPDRDLVGFYSNWEPCDIEWQSAQRSDGPLLNAYLASREGQVFHWFAMGWAHYALAAATGGSGYRLLASDLRYGFDSDPRRSVFSLSTLIDPLGVVIAPIHTGRTIPQDSGSALRNLLEATYTPACRFLQ